MTLFQPDPWGLETIREVPEMLQDVAVRGALQADCDDVAVLAAALGKAVGMKSRLVVFGFEGPRGPFAHVFTELYVGGGRWADMDVTRPPGGFMPPARASFLEV